MSRYRTRRRTRFIAKLEKAGIIRERAILAYDPESVRSFYARDMTPYIVTVKQRKSCDPIVPLQLVSRRAVATLDEAQQAVYDACEDAVGIADAIELSDLPAAGGEVPLLNGAVIEVRPVEWGALRDELDALIGEDEWRATPEGRAAMIAAYNEAAK